MQITRNLKRELRLIEEVAARQETALRALGYEEVLRRHLDDPFEASWNDAEGNERTVETDVFLDPDAMREGRRDLRVVVSVQPLLKIASFIPSAAHFLIEDPSA